MKYTIEQDSHYRSFLKEEGYGYIAVLSFPSPNKGLRVRPMNKGVDMSNDGLIAAAMGALEDLADAQEAIQEELNEFLNTTINPIKEDL